MCCGNINHQCEEVYAYHYSDSYECYGRGGIDSYIWSKEEKIEWLEGHLEDLQGEVKFIKECITALKGDEESLLEEGRRCESLFLFKNEKEGMQDENPNMADI